MNKQLENFARKTLKEGLAKCTDGEQLLFKRMYSPFDLEADINSVVDEMPIERLDWAMQQVESTLVKKRANR